MQNKRYKVGILGSTGMVGQNYIKLLQNHPWFKISHLAASPNSAGKKYREAVSEKWIMDTPLPEEIGKMKIYDVADIQTAKKKCDFVFSAFELSDKDLIRKTEEDYALNDLAVVSNASAHRFTEDVPMIMPEINEKHLEMIKIQRKKRGWKKGLIVVKPNCSLQSYILPIYALIKAGFQVNKLLLTTLQAVSGAGYPGVSSLDVIDNVLPVISGEEEKSEEEPLKILGEIYNNKFKNYDKLNISATCTRVPVTDGHLASVSMGFKGKKPKMEEIIKIWKNYKANVQKNKLPFAPQNPIIYTNKENRPQPKKDRLNDKGMTSTIGRLRDCPVLDYKFVCLSHNTIRGAAGGGILNAELLINAGYIKNSPLFK